VYLEMYTSILMCDKARLEALYGKPVIVADREMVESQADEILEGADREDVAFLVVGDPFGATTHTDLQASAPHAMPAQAAAGGWNMTLPWAVALLPHRAAHGMPKLRHHGAHLTRRAAGHCHRLRIAQRAPSRARRLTPPGPAHTPQLRAREKGIAVKVVHNASVMNAIGACGLQVRSTEPAGHGRWGGQRALDPALQQPARQARHPAPAQTLVPRVPRPPPAGLGAAAVQQGGVTVRAPASTVRRCSPQTPGLPPASPAPTPSALPPAPHARSCTGMAKQCPSFSSPTPGALTASTTKLSPTSAQHLAWQHTTSPPGFGAYALPAPCCSPMPASGLPAACTRTAIAPGAQQVTTCSRGATWRRCRCRCCCRRGGLEARERNGGAAVLPAACRRMGLHTLCLLDIKVKEPNLEMLARGGDPRPVPGPGRAAGAQAPAAATAVGTHAAPGSWVHGCWCAWRAGCGRWHTRCHGPQGSQVCV